MSRRLQSIDQALNELEQLASSNVATRQFLLLLLENAREYLEATSTQFLLPTTTSESTPWLKVASIPEATTLSAASLEQFPSHSDLGTPPSSNGGRSRSEEVQVWRGDATADAQELIAAAIKPGNLSKGMLVAEVGLAESPLEAQRQDELIKAYAELIGLRRDHDLDDLRQHWSQMAESLQALSDCEEQAESDFVLVNALARLCGASRVALVDQWTHSSCG